MGTRRPARRPAPRVPPVPRAPPPGARGRCRCRPGRGCEPSWHRTAIVAASVRVARSPTEPPAVRQFGDRCRSARPAPARRCGDGTAARDGSNRDGRGRRRRPGAARHRGRRRPPPPPALVRWRCGRRGSPRRPCSRRAHVATVEHPAAADPPPRGVFRPPAVRRKSTEGGGRSSMAARAVDIDTEPPSTICRIATAERGGGADAVWCSGDVPVVPPHGRVDRGHDRGHRPSRRAGSRTDLGRRARGCGDDRRAGHPGRRLLGGDCRPAHDAPANRAADVTAALVCTSRQRRTDGRRLADHPRHRTFDRGAGASQPGHRGICAVCEDPSRRQLVVAGPLVAGCGHAGPRGEVDGEQTSVCRDDRWPTFDAEG